MENEMNKKETDLTERPARSYPCDETPKRRSYPCDEKEEKRTYPCDTEDAGGQTERRPLGKGRRDGNSSRSIVVKSGKTPRYAKDKADLRSEYRGAWSGERSRDDGRSRYGADRSGYGSGRGGSENGDRDTSREGRGFGRGGYGHGRSEDRIHGDRSFRRSDEEKGGFRRRDDDRRNSFDRERRPGRPFAERYADRPARHAEEQLEGIEDFDKPQMLSVVQNTEIGSFLSLPGGEKVLLPFAEQIGRPHEGEQAEVYLYRDKGGRLTATMRKPMLKTGELGILKVADVTRIGIFLDNGVPKQLLVPFKEQVCTPKPGAEALVYLYRDKSGRQAATMRVYKYLSNQSPYQAEDKVKGFVYEINPQLGIFIAVDNRYFGMIPKPEAFETYQYGQTVECRVLRVREDGKLDLSAREKSYVSIDKDAELVLEELRANGGMLPYADKADAEMIESIYHMSKNQFKRAIGSLYRQRKIAIDREKDTITLLEQK